MSTAVEPVENNPSKGDSEEEDGPAGPQEFKWYLSPDPCYEILQKRWGLFTLIGFMVYAYHFIMTILGVDMYCHYTRFLKCDGDGKIIDNPIEADMIENTGNMDAFIVVLAIFHMIEWIRQWVFLTTVLVGVNWMKCFYLLSINIPFGFIVSLIGGIKGLTADSAYSCSQPQRTQYLKLQLLTFFLYMPFCLMHILVFFICNKMPRFKPDDKVKDDHGELTNELLYQSWLEKQHDMEEEEGDD